MKCENCKLNCKLNGKTVPKCRIEVIPKNGECNLDEKIVKSIVDIDEEMEQLTDKIGDMVEDFEEKIESRLGEGFSKLSEEIKKLLKVIGE